MTLTDKKKEKEFRDAKRARDNSRVESYRAEIAFRIYQQHRATTYAARVIEAQQRREEQRREQAAAQMYQYLFDQYDQNA